MPRFALSLFAAGPAGLAVLLLLALFAMPADEARADSGHPGGNFPLHQAAGEDGDLAAVIHLLGSAHAIDVNESPSGPPHYGGTPLHEAAYRAYATIAATLIAAGADVNAKDDFDDTPLHSFTGDAAVISLLLSAGADVNVKNNGGETPLHRVILNLNRAPEDVNVFAVSLLLLAGADVNAKDIGGGTPLHLAVYRNRTSVVSLLVSAGADVNAKDNGDETPLHNAAIQGHASLVSVLLSAGADVNVKDYSGETPLHYAARRHDRATIAAMLIAAGADVNAKGEFGQTPLHFALFWGSDSFVSVLLSAGADVNAKDNDGNTPLHYAADQERAPFVSALLLAGANVNAKDNYGRTPLHSAAFRGGASVVSLLLMAGADVNAKDNDGNTPLNYVASRGYAPAVSALLSAGANVNAKGNDGKTPLHQAVSNGHASVVSLLLLAGADVNEKIDAGIGTLLHLAAYGGNAPIVSLLLSAGADVHAKNGSGYMPLHWAAFQGGASVVSLLLLAGADVNAKDNDGHTPLRESCNAFNECRPTPVRFALIAAGGHWGEACADMLSVNPAGPFPLCVALSAGICGELNPPQFYDAPRDECVAYPGGDYPLHYAAGRDGNLAAVVQLLRLGSGRGFDVNEKNNFGRTPLYYAAGWGHATIVVTLLSAGADAHAKDNDGETPLHRAADNGHAPVVSLLLSAGAKADEEAGFVRHTPLHLAAGSGHAAVVSLLLSAGAEVNAKNLIDNTPLHHAAKSAHASAVSLLLSARADVNAKNIYGNTPLHETSDAGFSSCAGSAAACAAVRPVLIAAGAHWGEACAGAAVVNPAGPAVPCLCESPNVGAADNCQAPSAAACGGLIPAKFYSAEKSACVPYAPCVGGTLNLETNACECPNRLAALGDGVCEYKAATCEMLGGVVEDERVCSGIDINDTFCIVDSDSAFPCLGLFYHVWLCNDRFNRPALDPWHCGKTCSEGLRARGAKCAAD